jgi:hypothetical protein
VLEGRFESNVLSVVEGLVQLKTGYWI